MPVPITTHTAQMGSMQADIDETAGELATLLSRLDFLMAELPTGWQTAGSAVFFQGMEVLGQELNGAIKDLLGVAQTVGLSRTTYDSQIAQEQDLAQRFKSLIGNPSGAAPVAFNNF
ncbi:MAG: WXG100 family type VII secretion target [Mycobacteriales bacterium]|jgi:uncharacterized protein YukE